MTLRAIFFDAGNTLLRMNYAAIAAALGRHGVSATAADVQRAEWLARVRLDTDVLAYASSTESRDTHVRYLRYILEGLGVTEEATIDAVDAWRRAYNVPVGLWNTADPDAAACLDAVRAAGVRSAVISNSNGTIRSLMQHLGLIDKLDFVIDSGEEGVEKPARRIFEIALVRAGVEADDTAYIGDLYSIDVRGARSAGIRPVLLDPGQCWGPRDCDIAPSVLEAVRFLLERARQEGSVTNG
ncbi:MAG TPA: HAD-IA family hydrolase [Methylomirabilota bacterium]|nr:HAD-IA family hydrolase [Methylomirabilota bacterium]